MCSEGFEKSSRSRGGRGTCRLDTVGRIVGDGGERCRARCRRRRMHGGRERKSVPKSKIKFEQNAPSKLQGSLLVAERRVTNFQSFLRVCNNCLCNEVSLTSPFDSSLTSLSRNDCRGRCETRRDTTKVEIRGQTRTLPAWVILSCHPGMPPTT